MDNIQNYLSNDQLRNLDLLESKHGRVYRKVLQYIKMIIFGQTPKSSSKVLFELHFVFMVPSVVVLGTQI